MKGDTDVKWTHGFYGAGARLAAKNLSPSPYSLDDVEKIKKLMLDRFKGGKSEPEPKAKEAGEINIEDVPPVFDRDEE